MTIIGMEERADQAVRLAQRPQLGDPLRPDQLERHADRIGGAAVFAVLVHPLLVGREAQVAGLVEAHGLAGLGLKRLVQIDTVFVQLANAVAHVEQRQQPRRVPGRARRQLVLLNQHDVRAAELGQVIGDAAPNDAAADHHHLCVLLHGAPPAEVDLMPSRKRPGSPGSTAPHPRHRDVPSAPQASLW